MKKIFFDNIIFSLQRAGGISVVWYELLKRILSDTATIDKYFIEYTNRNICRKYLNIPEDNILKRSSFILFIRRYLNQYIKENKPFIFHSSYYRTASNKNAINITTVHDFTYEYYAKGLKRKIHSWQKFRAIRNSDYIICISENTKHDLLKFLPDVDKHKIKIIYNGVSENYFPMNDENIPQLPFEKNKYILFVGSRAVYKNFDLTVKAVALSRYNLVIVGHPLSGKEKSFLDKTIGALRFKYIGYISDEALNIVYNNAFSLVYPSVYEGFGIPVIEAQKAGCPVIAYNGSSIPEIIGNTPLLLNDLSAEQIVSCFGVLENEQYRMEIINNGLENAKRFTWDRMYKQIIEVYKEAWDSKLQ
jgi:mannosyltransferase